MNRNYRHDEILFSALLDPHTCRHKKREVIERLRALARSDSPAIDLFVGVLDAPIH